MTTTERKRRLKFQIDLSSDETLDKIENLLEKEIIEIPESILNDLLEAEENVKNGNFVTNEELEKELEEWLNED